ncbi:MAG TPA: hypothetical protein PLQ00_08360, partial [Thermoguttaceae bacterium]|nr:hypothetical protein [Thermoguttaceae bacterium]
MSRSARSENKGSRSGFEKPVGTLPQTSCQAASPPTAGQRLFLWLTAALLAGWIILLSLLAWWS